MMITRAIVVSTALLFAGGASFAAELACPAKRPGGGQALAGVEIAEIGPDGKDYVLAPEDGKGVQTWRFKPEANWSFRVRCRYARTAEVVQLSGQGAVVECRFRFTQNQRGRIAKAKSVVCTH